MTLSLPLLKTSSVSQMKSSSVVLPSSPHSSLVRGEELWCALSERAPLLGPRGTQPRSYSQGWDTGAWEAMLPMREGLRIFRKR